MESLSNRLAVQQLRYNRLTAQQQAVECTIKSAQDQMDKIAAEQALLERSTKAIQQAKPLLSASSIKQCEELANSAIRTIFDMDCTVEYNPETCRFQLNKGEFSTDLAEAEGGGLVTVISFCFSIFLLIKLGKRRFMAFDEAFTQVSSKYFPNFIQFVRTLCKDLGCDIVLISHDQRITTDDVDCAYVIEEGHSKRIK